VLHRDRAADLGDDPRARSRPHAPARSRGAAPADGRAVAGDLAAGKGGGARSPRALRRLLRHPVARRRDGGARGAR
jgi:hypothetical protein